MDRVQVCDFLLGVGVGATAALLLTPESGRQTRSRITGAATDGTTYLKQRGEKMRKTALDVMKHRKEDLERQITRQKEGLKEALKQGSHAYRQVVAA
jgi:gas vesicle protein